MYQAELPKHILPFQNIPLALASLGGLNTISFLKIKNTVLKGYTEIKKMYVEPWYFIYSAFELFGVS